MYKVVAYSQAFDGSGHVEVTEEVIPDAEAESVVSVPFGNACEAAKAHPGSWYATTAGGGWSDGTRTIVMYIPDYQAE